MRKGVIPAKTSHRLLRVETQLMREIAVLLEREIEDPRIRDITISRLKLSKDLRYAKIYFTLLDEKGAQKTGYALNHAVSYLRRRVGELLALRVVPELFFIYDEELLQAQSLTQLIDRL